LLQAMLVARVLEPASKLATPRSACCTTRRPPARWAACWAWAQCGVDDQYRALDWLHEAQPAIERRLARQHLLAPGKEFHIYRHPMGRWHGRLPSPPKAERVVSEGS